MLSDHRLLPVYHGDPCAERAGNRSLKCRCMLSGYFVIEETVKIPGVD